MVLRLTQQIRCVPVQNKHSVKRETERERSNSDHTAWRTYVSLLLILRHTGGKNDSRKLLQLVSPSLRKSNLRVQQKDLSSVLDTVRRAGGGGGGWRESDRKRPTTFSLRTIKVFCLQRTESKRNTLGISSSLQQSESSTQECVTTFASRTSA